MIIDGIKINHEGISGEEALEYLKIQKELYPNRTLIALDITLDGDDVILTPHYDTVVRVRRITGYLSNVKNFNAAKKEEAFDRVVHF